MVEIDNVELEFEVIKGGGRSGGGAGGSAAEILLQRCS